VPEAAVHEDGEFLDLKEEIRTTNYVSRIQIPAADGALHQYGAKSPFRRPVTTGPNGLHVLAPSS
jgi:hypothetical protein